jgi:hypothetical protein
MIVLSVTITNLCPNIGVVPDGKLPPLVVARAFAAQPFQSSLSFDGSGLRSSMNANPATT